MSRLSLLHPPAVVAPVPGVVLPFRGKVYYLFGFFWRFVNKFRQRFRFFFRFTFRRFLLDDIRQRPFLWVHSVVLGLFLIRRLQVVPRFPVGRRPVVGVVPRPARFRFACYPVRKTDKLFINPFA